MVEIAKEYADALFSVALDEQQVDAFAQGLDLIEQVFAENPAYLGVLSSPNVSIRQRKDLLKEAFAAAVPGAVLSFLQLLCEKGHIALFGVCVREYRESLESLRRMSTARVISAVDLNQDEKKAIAEKLCVMAGKNVTCVYEVDAAILGGLIIYMDDAVIDGSVRRKLQALKEELIQ